MANVPWLADVLRDGGCTVIEEGDWKNRGRPSGAFDPRALMLHHDASPAGETSNGADVLINGRPGLEGPLCHLWLDYDGRWHCIAAGRANHAGEGINWGVVRADQGNADSIGIETDHTTDEQWTDLQRTEGGKGLLALARHMDLDPYTGLLAHKEYAPSRKVDPDPLDMDRLRDLLASALEDDVPFTDDDAMTVWHHKVPYDYAGDGNDRQMIVAQEELARAYRDASAAQYTSEQNARALEVVNEKLDQILARL